MEIKMSELEGKITALEKKRDMVSASIKLN